MSDESKPLIFNVSIDTKRAVGNMRIGGVSLVLTLIKDIMKTKPEETSVTLSKDGFLEISVVDGNDSFKATSENTMTEDELDCIKFLSCLE